MLIDQTTPKSSLHIEAFKQTLRKIWHPFKPLKFHEPGLGVILAEFSDANDKDHALDDGPWHFDKCLVLVKVIDGSQQI